MSYIASLPHGISTGLIPHDVESEFFTEAILSSPLRPFMGTSDLSVIKTMQKEVGHGLTETYSFSRSLDYKNVIYDYDQISGRGQQAKFYEDTITARQQSIPNVLPGLHLLRYKTPIKVFERQRPLLMDAQQRNLTWSILKAATTDSYPSYTANGPVTDRVVFQGAAYNAAINTAVAAMGNATYDASGLSVDSIFKLRDLAIYGGTTFEKEKRINPFKIEKNMNFPSPYYVYFLDTPSFNSLRKDPQWDAQVTRGVIESSQYQPSALSGSFFKGMLNNVMIYELPELGNFQVTSGGKTASWNLFCGAGAFSVLWCKPPWFPVEYTNMQTIMEMAIMEIRGQKSIKFASFQDESKDIENGIIHHFVRIA